MVRLPHVVVPAIACAWAATAAAAPYESITPIEGVVVAPAARTVYVMGPNALVAIDIVTGKQRWTTTAAIKPYLQHGTAVVALGADGKLVVLDAKTGKPYAKCKTFPNIAITLQNSMRTEYTSFGYSDGQRAWIDWSESSHYVGGRPPTPAQQAAASSRSEGSYSLDLDACTATAGPVVKLPTLERKDEPNKAVFRTKTASGIDVRLEQGGGLHLFRDGKDIDLTEGIATKNQWSASIDLGAIVVHDSASGALAIYDLETGAVTRGTNPYMPYTPAIFGNVIIAMGPPRPSKLTVPIYAEVVGIDVTKGKELWSQPIRDNRYHGSYPP